MSLHRGWECFSTDPGVLEKCACRVCGEDCEVKRNVNGPTSWAESVGGMKHLHDFFVCKHVQEDWHIQIRSLKQEQENTKSSAIKEILEAEIAQIYVTKKPTEGWERSWRDY